MKIEGDGKKNASDSDMTVSATQSEVETNQFVENKKQDTNIASQNSREEIDGQDIKERPSIQQNVDKGKIEIVDTHQAQPQAQTQTESIIEHPNPQNAKNHGSLGRELLVGMAQPTQLATNSTQTPLADRNSNANIATNVANPVRFCESSPNRLPPLSNSPTPQM